MDQLRRNGSEHLETELEEVGRSIRSSFQIAAGSSRRSSIGSTRIDDDDEYELTWAALERLPTFERVRTTVFDHGENESDSKDKVGKKLIDVTKLGAIERHLIMENLIKHIERDNLHLLKKQKGRIDRVNVKLPTIEVRYKNLSVEAECQVVEGKPLPTLWNAAKLMLSVRRLSHMNMLVLSVSMTLVLGPPGCGKTTFLQALSGKLDKSLKVRGEVTYNGLGLEEFVPEKTSAYISQYDLHIPEMTVRETLDFSARFQGVGSRAEIMKQVSRREKQAGIIPDPDIDTYMKAISVEGLERSLQTDYILKIMGLGICADTITGDAMRRGISGGEKKRLTTGEMIVGPTKALFMDEISTGLDSSTTFQIVTCLQQFAHITESTVVVSLLQPAPETYELFDDIILMAEGKIVYHGPRSDILGFFENCGFKCPERKGVADFLQEVLSIKDQEQYWFHLSENYTYISVDQFRRAFKAYEVGQSLSEELSKPYDKSQCHENALSFNRYSLSKWELLKACMAREFLLMKRNSFIYIFKTTQLGILAIITATVFLRTHMGVDELHANYYMGSLFFALILLLVNGFPEVAMTCSRLPVFYKQRDYYFYPAWAYSIPAAVLKIPISLLESFVWTTITYFVIGYKSRSSFSSIAFIYRYFRHLLLLFCLHQMSLSLFRFNASYFQAPVASTVGGTAALLVILLFGGFIIPKPTLPSWLKWGFWISPLSYTEVGLAVNEFRAPRWQKMSSANMTIGQQVLISRGLNYDSHFYWIAVGALLVSIILLNVAFTLALTFRRHVGVSRAIISREKLAQIQDMENRDNRSDRNNKSTTGPPVASKEPRRTGNMVLPFIPLTISFQDVNYYVDTPPEMKEQGYTGKRLQLLHNITGALQPGILSALMGVSGAGKTTLLDVLSGRKTGGYIEGDIRIGGFPKVQETFARISGYCEQSDIHSPQITVKESITYSAWLRLPPEIDAKTRSGVTGLSTEQRKRLTIAVELVSNPSIIFMDEPTSGLDARAAAIVMRAVKNVAETGRTVVCTIHQPSIDIFEAFDELILMRRGGELIYTGPIGKHSNKIIEYFEGISGVPRIRDNYNPATWMLEVTTTSMEMQLGVDFAQIYKESSLYEESKMLVKRLSIPPPDSKDLSFPTRYPQNSWVQFKACLWKQYLSYWRSPSYNLVRILFTIFTSITLGLIFWQRGQKLNTQQDMFNMLASIYVTTVFIGINNCSSVLPFVTIERTIVYREKFAGMYTTWAYSLAQVAIEIPYVLIEVILLMIIAYPAIGYYWTATKFFWTFYAMFCTVLYYVYLGMLMVSLTPNVQVAAILSSVCYSLFNLFSGFIVPRPQIPKWWIWLYYISPMSWSLNGLFSSQYGDVQKEIMVFGETKSVASFLKDYFGFHQNLFGLVAVVLLAFPIIYATLFAYFIGKLNFQRR
ncbi:ABC transporter G family member 41-like [Canna indica]|uniref:ABC transporter G family member 41-like n=1 Tax=Canna indica TaxID=4628 RepID=A0AAQ3JXP2_9LILI|nr:ABC transporter G family member 41-like [Canna indica]